MIFENMADFSVLIQMLVLLLITGAFAGVLAGALGVGGGIVLVPAFLYVFGVLGFTGPQVMQLSLATSLATIMVTSVRSVMNHNKKGAVEWDILRTWAPGIIFGAALGVWVASSLRADVLQIIFGALVMIVATYVVFSKTSWRIADMMPTGLTRLMASPIVGFLSVLLGIGGGSFGVPIMTLHGVPIHRAVATAAGFGLLIAMPAVVGFLFLPVDPTSRPPFTVGSINLAAFGIIIAMTLLTAPLGVRLAHGLDPDRLKRAFGVFLVLVGLNMLRKVAGL